MSEVVAVEMSKTIEVEYSQRGDSPRMWSMTIQGFVGDNQNLELNLVTDW